MASEKVEDHSGVSKTFRDTLLESKLFKDCYQGSASIEELEVDFDDDMEEGLEDEIPSVKIFHDLRDPWRLTEIKKKFMGKTIAFNDLMNIITIMWKLSGDFELIDLGYGFYVVKFAYTEDRSKVMTGEQWKIMDHYLVVQRWISNFKPSNATIGSTAAWIQLPGQKIACKKSMDEDIAADHEEVQSLLVVVEGGGPWMLLSDEIKRVQIQIGR
ncbi:hypothetical protein REPUB_Repub10bG0103700 [Reevesia pubescens]